MPHINQHQTGDGTTCRWSNMDIGFPYAGVVCPHDCPASLVIEDTFATRPVPTTAVRWRTVTLVEHEALIPASAMQVALELSAGAAGADPEAGLPDAVGRLLERQENLYSCDDNIELTESRRLVNPEAGLAVDEPWRLGPQAGRPAASAMPAADDM